MGPVKVGNRSVGAGIDLIAKHKRSVEAISEIQATAGGRAPPPAPEVLSMDLENV